MKKVAVVAAAILVATLFSGNAFALTSDDVARVICCHRKVVRIRGCRVRVYCVPRPRGCETDFGLSVQ
ncbi:MAG: hypothetical protein ACLPWS_20070 [Rhodomicrobium sp.]